MRDSKLAVSSALKVTVVSSKYFSAAPVLKQFGWNPKFDEEFCNKEQLISADWTKIQLISEICDSLKRDW